MFPNQKSGFFSESVWFSRIGKFIFFMGKQTLVFTHRFFPKDYICKKNKVVGRNRKKPFYQEIKIENIGSEGKALARVGDLVVFTKYGVPGDVVDIQVTKKRKRYSEGVITHYHKYSNERAEPFCDHFGVCGGCKWQYLPYVKQLEYKQVQVFDQLTRIGKIEIQEQLPILGSLKNTYYRNKLEFTFSNNRWIKTTEKRDEVINLNALGFHIPGLFDKIINIDKCWLQPEPSNKIRNFIYKYALEQGLEFFDIKAQRGFLRTLILRTSSIGEVMVILSFYKEDADKRTGLMQAVKNEFTEITSLLYVINSKGNDTITDQEIKVFSGREYIVEKMENLEFIIGPKSFYQTNSEQAYNLYKIVRDFAEFKGEELVYDLYTGTGTIANFVAGNVRQVIGIEYIPEAIADAKANSKNNKIENTEFYAGDIKNLLNNDFIKENGRPDIIITDPPRAGMHDEVIKTILEIGAGKIIYVSCNPATQARDISLLQNSYKVAKIQPVDMFPHTHHVENVALLVKK